MNVDGQAVFSGSVVVVVVVSAVSDEVPLRRGIVWRKKLGTADLSSRAEAIVTNAAAIEVL